LRATKCWSKKDITERHIRERKAQQAKTTAIGRDSIEGCLKWNSQIEKEAKNPRDVSDLRVCDSMAFLSFKELEML
jgi:hypothetical protein